MDAVKVWEPSEAVKRGARITAYMQWLERQRGLRFADYDALWRWSVTDLEAFWASIWDYFDIKAATRYQRVLGERTMPGAQWFAGARLNYVDQIFRHKTSARPAVVFRNEAGDRAELSWDELERQVAALAASLRGMGVGPGDRVVAYMPNIPEAVVSILAVISLGAVWSLCSPDMGQVAVLDRFRQIAPKVLIAVDGYRWGGKPYDRCDVVLDLLRGLPSVEKLVLLPYLNPAADARRFPNGVAWESLIQGRSTLAAEPVPFDHPLWVVYSSGTTGMPKPIVHCQGGIVLEHLKLMALHNDVGPEDRFHWFSSTGWVMWNLQVAGLLVGATICIYDGNPAWPDYHTLWRFAGEVQASFFGAGAAFYTSCLKTGVEPTQVANLARLRTVGSTGSPLPPEAYRWIYDHVRQDVWLTSMSGGTDFAGAFVGGVPILPVYLGEMQARCLGAKVEAYDDAGKPVLDEVGELVCTAPMPSMPLYFWNDAGNKRYQESYFDVYPGVWLHGDWIRITPRGGAVIYGRSDSTINRHGVRMGTSELYRAVEDMDELLDSLVVDLEYLGRESYMPLFVVLRPGVELTEELKARIKDRIRTAMSARHVPNDVFQVDEIPRTLSGKKLEVPIKKLLLGQPLEKVVNRDSMANPGSLDWFVQFAGRRNPPG